MTGQGLRLVCVLLGLALPLYLTNLPSFYGLASLAALAVYLFFWSQFRLVFFFTLGVIASCLHLVLLLDKQLPQEYEGQDVSALVEITSMPERKGKNTRFEAKISGVDKIHFPWQGKGRLSWYYAPEIKVGDKWQLQLRLKRPRGFANGRGFDYQAWLLSQKIFATGYVRNADNNQRLDTHSSLRPRQLHELALFEHLREKLSTTLFDNSDFQQSRFMRALLLGDKSGLTQNDWQLLQSTGTLHLMAISGLHIGLIAGFGFLIGRLLVSVCAVICGTRLFLHYIAPTFSLLFAFIYAGLAGFSIPTQRAFIFVLLVNVAVVLGRRLNYFNLLALCAIIVALIDPFAFLAAGFYLSFCAVAVLFWCFMGRTTLVSSLGQRVFAFISAQWILFIGLLVPLSVLSLPTSVSGLLANSIAIPLVGMLIVPLLFLAALLSFISDQLVYLLLSISDFLLTHLWYLLSYLGDFKFGSFRVFLVGPLAILALAFAALIVLSPRALTLRVLCLPLLIVAFLSSPGEKPRLELTVLDVGQGLSVFVKWPQGSLLYDTGARFSDDFDIGSRVIVPWLQAGGLRSLDYLVVSHGDNDHAGGMHGLLSGFSVKNIYLGSSVELENKKINALPCERGQIYNDAEMSVKVLWPKVGMPDFENNNNSSCVLLLEFAGKKILLTGDIEKEVEWLLLSEGVLPQDIDVLVAPHHGSRTSSTQAFVQHLKPEVVVFSAGYMNRYHHPNNQVQQRYQQAGSQLLRTDLHGAVNYTLTANGESTLTTARKDQKRPWFW